MLSGPLGLPVGATPGIAYDETVVTLDADDRVLLYTSGLVLGRDTTLADGLDVLRRAGGETDLDDVAGFLDYVAAQLAGAPDSELCLLVAHATK